MSKKQSNIIIMSKCTDKMIVDELHLRNRDILERWHIQGIVDDFNSFDHNYGHATKFEAIQLAIIVEQMKRTNETNK